MAHFGTVPSMSCGSAPSITTTAPRPPGSWAKNTSAGELSPSSNRVAGDLGGLAILHRHVDAGSLPKLVDDRPHQRLAPARVDDQRAGRSGHLDRNLFFSHACGECYRNQDHDHQSRWDCPQRAVPQCLPPIAFRNDGSSHFNVCRNSLAQVTHGAWITIHIVLDRFKSY